MNKEDIRELRGIKNRIAKLSDVLWDLRMELAEIILDYKKDQRKKQYKLKKPNKNAKNK